MLNKRAREGKEDPARLSERLGLASAETPGRPRGPLIWIHGASVGESLSHLPLIARIRAERPDISVLVTTATRTAASLMARRLPEGAFHQYVPVDTPQAARRFLERWQPDLAIFVESELWPNLLMGLRQRRVPVALLSARMTEKSYRGWMKWPTSARSVLRAFSIILPQDTHTASRIGMLGGTVGPLANLKGVGLPLPADNRTLMALHDALGSAPRLLAASTHTEEEVLIASVWDTLPEPKPRLILAPRHPERGDAIAAELRAAGIRVAQRSREEPITPETEIYLADTLGELGLFFRLADTIVLGGSFTQGIGGHNPLEPARLGKAVITGPDLYNWDAVIPALEARRAIAITPPSDLGKALRLAQRDRVAYVEAGQRARDVAAELDKALDVIWAYLAPLLPIRGGSL